MREINTPLADGLEAKKLLIAEKEEARQRDSINFALQQTIDNMNRASKITSDNLWHSEARNENCMSRLSNAKADAEKWQKRARTWKTVAFIGGAIILAGGGTAYFITK